MTVEQQRIEECERHLHPWKKWGPYLSDRAWGTVREDYSADGSAWAYFPHDWARSKAYRWNEDGLLGISDDRQFLCFALALWNGRDPIIKERLFGLSGPEGNHGEDVKELYYYLDSTPTHSYMKALYKYPQAPFPYEKLVTENARRTRDEPEYELLDTWVFDENRYFDVYVEYAKAGPEDVLIRISATNHGPESAALHLLPTIWFRNIWSWDGQTTKPNLSRMTDVAGQIILRADHAQLGKRWLLMRAQDNPRLLFTENETNFKRLYPDAKIDQPAYAKDGINDYIVKGDQQAVNPQLIGTKVAADYELTIAAGQTRTICLRLMNQLPTSNLLGKEFEDVFKARKSEADAFYRDIDRPGMGDDLCNIQRQAFAGLLWNKQFYHFDVEKWLQGDAAQPAPPDERWRGRNIDWRHLNNMDILSMPDKWEYPWYASWDLAFHCIPLAMVDCEFAKQQLIKLLREWYMHPSGQVPAYEWAFGDANPPVHAWAALRVYRIERKHRGRGDIPFLERIFHKLLINFTWWVNRKDRDGRNLFQGGFLGLDNIGLFDRNIPLPNGAYLDQCDGTSWMAMYCLNMLAISLELAGENPIYEDVATKFLEHFFYIANAMNNHSSVRGDDVADLWDDVDGFYYDLLRHADGSHTPLRVRSVVGLIPLLAVETLDEALLNKLPDFAMRLEWFLDNRPDICRSAASVVETGAGKRRLFSVVNRDRLCKILTRALDEKEFLSPYGLRSLSKHHLDHPFQLKLDGQLHSISYEPAESTTTMFGGNSNWRGPVWFPLNYLIIESLQKFDYYYGDSFKAECPTGSGKLLTLWEVAADLSRRLTSIFQRSTPSGRPVFGDNQRLQTDPNFCDYPLFYEYFHGDSGEGLGASHQTGWTALVAKLIQQRQAHSSA
ncbi:MAG: glucosidase [Phycisphaerales bacterium]|nr:glucosidase [Phycisphaerales bacterium]